MLMAPRPKIQPRAPCPASKAFTLLELLVVVGVIALLAATSVPAIRSISRTNIVAAGNRQMLDDLSYARQLAISGRRTVYIVFVPPTMRFHFDTVRKEVRNPVQQRQILRQMTNLVTGQYTAYALFSRRTVGDQPGRQNPRYLTPWKYLPDGIFVATNKFIDLGDEWVKEVDKRYSKQYTNRPLPYAYFPFPTATSPELRMPYIAFDPAGRVFYEERKYPAGRDQQDAWITLSRGSIFYPKNAQTPWAFDLSSPPDVVETPKGNRTDIRVNWLTGRAQAEEAKLK